jgi:branched-chain amino acid transport system substrate-binding protein
VHVRRAPILLAVLACLAAGCGGSSSGSKSQTLTISVNASFSKTPYVADTIANGAKLAVLELPNSGTVTIGGTAYTLKVVKYDTGGSPVTAVSNVRRAVDADALAIVDEGTGVDASWPLANKAHIPIGIVYQGGVGLVDPARRPNVFRIAPTDHGVAFRLAEYLIPKGLKIALLHDDSGYGQEGAAALDQAFGSNPKSVSTKLTLPSAATDLAPQLLAARRSGATAVLVWAQGPVIAKALIAARSAGWNVPFYTPCAGADPVVRQTLADHPQWVNGLTFTSGRLTAEEGPAPFYAFANKYRTAFGVEKVGVKTSKGYDVIQPPEYGMYAYDFVRLLIAAMQQAGGASDRAKLLDQMNQVTIQGANGDERGFNEKSHEGVVDDDVYFARFHDMTYAPVEDDPLSKTLPPIIQTS